MRSQLARYQPVTPLTEDEVHQLASRLYREKNKILVCLDELFDGPVKRDLIAYANKKYGKAQR